ncbi:C4-dicarboxylate TRAP transporter substrate-binding protein [Halomonas sp. MCCC 1A11036]|uniref:C4-dicarboxylate TRAP transporter substrate-binding protein n=1 Tax=Billgrantia zhangzhouensis TaxID=2733481 RepID=A0ABS9AI65_9GAMM|nr:C4-dicarboxylate TRAP transporter substrate-binding protein [Halomonas zhangzhouensis]MCE8021462.1 C4-dicarboxylate TRAP transporter substrate-binding protein [Halomonas zhangzhouensis]
MKIIKSTTLGAAMLTATMSNTVIAETLRWGDHFPECCNMYTKAAEWMAEEVNERTEGELQFRIQFGGVLASVQETPTAIETGMIHMGNIVVPYFPEQMPINNALPFFTPNTRNQREVGELWLEWHEEIPAFSEELARYNAKLITVRPLSNYGFFCTTPIETLEDFRGKRIRTYGVALPALVEALGGVPVSFVDVEMYEAMSNNILDCTTSDIGFVDSFQLHEVASYFIDVPLGANWGQIIAMNLDKYNALPEDHKAILEEIKHEHLDELLRLFEEEEARIKAHWEEENLVEIIDFPDDEFLEVALQAEGVQAARESWVQRAIAAGMSPEDAQRVVDDITE